MRAALLLLLLAGCLPWGEQGSVVEQPGEETAIEVSTLDGPEPEPVDDLLPAPEITEAPPAPPPLPPALAAQTRACAAQGGTLRPRGVGGLWSCVRATADAGRSCQRESDCEGICLARSGTCAPFEPLYGCHEALDGLGRLQTVCRE